MGTSGVGFSNSPHDFLPKWRDFEHLFTIGSAEKLSHCESRCHTDLKMMASEVISQIQPEIFHPSAGIFGL